MNFGRHLATVEDLVSREPEVRPFIVDGMIFERTFNMVVGKYGSAKSFFLLYLALCIAACVPTLGNRLAHGVVVYVYAEGAAGLSARVRAFCQHRGLTPESFGERILFLCKKWDATEDEFTAEIQAELAARGIEQVDLIVFDTLSANAFLGFDENRTADMKLLNDGFRRLQQLFNCAILVCHHAGHGGERERGSSDLGASCDAIFLVEKQGDAVTVKQTKARDVAVIEPMRLRLQPVDDSAVLVSADGDDGAEAPSVSLAPSARNALATLVEYGAGEPVSNQAWFYATKLQKTAYYAARKALVEAGFVLRHAKGFVPTNKADRLLNIVADVRGLSAPDSADVRPRSPLIGGRADGHAEAVRELRNGLRADTRAEGPGLQPYAWPDLEQSA